MKRQWNTEDLAIYWQIWPEEQHMIDSKRLKTRLGFAALLKFFQIENRFPSGPQEIPVDAAVFLATRLNADPEDLWSYPWQGRSYERHRAEIRTRYGFREATLSDCDGFKYWLITEVIPNEHRPDQVREVLLARCRHDKIEPPTLDQINRLIKSALQEHETKFCNNIKEHLMEPNIKCLDALLQTKKSENDAETPEWTLWQSIKSDPGRAGLSSVLKAAERLAQVRALKLPSDLFKGAPPNLTNRYAKRATVEEPFELRRHDVPLRVTLLTTYLHHRSEELTDHLVDLLVEITHKMGKNAERKVDEGAINQIKKVPKKVQILVRVAKASLSTPKGIVDEVIYPIASEEVLRNIVQEMENTEVVYQDTVRETLTRSYRSHYRRMLPILLTTLEFRCTNTRHQPVMNALALLKSQLDNKNSFYPKGTEVPLDGVVKFAWLPLVVEKEVDGKVQVNRIAYEICVLKALREQLRCREIWIVGVLSQIL